MKQVTCHCSEEDCEIGSHSPGWGDDSKRGKNISFQFIWGHERNRMTRELKERRESREDLGAKCTAFLWFYLEEAELEVCRLWRIVPLILLCWQPDDLAFLWYSLWKPGFSGGASRLGRSPGGRSGNPLLYSCEKFHGHRSLKGYSPWGHTELDTAEHIILLET